MKVKMMNSNDHLTEGVIVGVDDLGPTYLVNKYDEFMWGQ